MYVQAGPGVQVIEGSVHASCRFSIPRSALLYRSVYRPSKRMDVKRCRCQHEVLVTYIRFALQCWGPVDDLSVSYWIDDTVTPWKPSSPIQVTPELKRVLTRARILSEDCCTELPPPKAVLRHVQWSQAFVDIVKEIQWCISVVYNGSICSRNATKSAPLFKDFPWQAKIGYQEKFLLEKAEQEDWQQLMLELQNYCDLHHCSVEECGNMHGRGDPCYCLATQAMRRFVLQEMGRSELDHKSLLWSFDPEVLNRGLALGSGAFGMVTEVTWLGSKYARKTFNPSGLHSLAAEAETLGKLNHPHIVKVYAYSEDSILMDLMCTDLHKFMKSRTKGGARDEPFSLRASMDLMLQIADAVNYLHTQGVAHRDLKSSNILVNVVNTPGLDEDDGFVFAKIADFGEAKIKRDITRYSHLTPNVGTRRWMAPEIFGANIEDDHLEHAFPMKADVYSFGIICFEILTGQVPFNNEQMSTLYSKLTAQIPLRPQLPSSCPTNLASLICECWEADPQKRPAFEDVCRVLRYLKGLPTLIALNDPQLVPIDGEWPFGRLTPIVEVQSVICTRPFAKVMLRNFTVGPVADIRGVKFLFHDPEKVSLSGFIIMFNIGGQQLESCIVGYLGVLGISSEWIRFDHPNEYLVQVKGSKVGDFGRILTLSFITTKQEYGPYGRNKGSSHPFCSERGRVVGIGWALTSNHISHLTIKMIPNNIVWCLQQYLRN